MSTNGFAEAVGNRKMQILNLKMFRSATNFKMAGCFVAIRLIGKTGGCIAPGSPRRLQSRPLWLSSPLQIQQWIVSDRHEVSNRNTYMFLLLRCYRADPIIQTRLAKINREDPCAVMQASVTGTSIFWPVRSRLRECILPFFGLITQNNKARCISGKFLIPARPSSSALKEAFSIRNASGPFNDLLHHSTVVSSSLSSGTTFVHQAHFNAFLWHRIDRTGTRSRGFSFCPTMRARYDAPKPPSKLPTFGPVCPKRAFSALMVRSHTITQYMAATDSPSGDSRDNWFGNWTNKFCKSSTFRRGMVSFSDIPAMTANALVATTANACRLHRWRWLHECRHPHGNSTSHRSSLCTVSGVNALCTCGSVDADAGNAFVFMK